MSNIKGSAVDSLYNFAKDHGGEETWKKMLDTLSEESRAAFSPPIIIIKWYPLDHYNHLVDAARVIIGNNDHKIGIEIGKRIVQDGLTSIYKVFLTALSPNFLMNKAPLIWKKYFDAEQLNIVIAEKNQVVAQVSGDLNPLPVYCQSILGAMSRTITLAGGTIIQAQETRCRSRGNGCCEYSFTWR